MPLPPLEVLRRANDKHAVVEAAKHAGIPVPRTGDAPFPLVVKLRDDEGLYLEPEQRYRIVHDGGELERAKRELFPRRETVVQEFIPGDGYGVGPDPTLNPSIDSGS